MRNLLVIGAALTLGGCGQSPPTSAGEGPGAVSVSWVGRDTGSFVATARGSWCPADSMLQVTAVRGDTGLGFALFAGDTVAPGQHPVVSPEVGVEWRPQARAALRWFYMRPAGGPGGTTTDVRGWEATSGVVSVTATDSGPSGTLDLHLRALGGFDTLRLTGSFTAVPVAEAVGACGRMNRPAPAGR